MGNAVSPCFGAHCVGQKKTTEIKVVLWGGLTRTMQGEKPLPAGPLMVEFPDQLLCHGGSFYIGLPVPALSIGDRLVPGETYFLIPADRLACRLLTAGTIAALRPPQPANSNGARMPLDFGSGSPFIRVKTSGGDPLIKVSEEFIEKMLGGGVEKQRKDGEEDAANLSGLCSTPELKKHYEQLVVSTRVQPWSPKLETISESRKRQLIPGITFSPVRLSPIMLSPVRTLTGANKKQQGLL